MTFPTLSVVTAVYNGAATLDICITSVAAQTHLAVEHVIVDGGSHDGTLDILRRNKGQVRYISESDRGIYDAMNKGVAMATGEWVLFLGADDRLACGDTIYEFFADCPADLSPFAILTGYARYADGRLYRSNNPRGLQWRNRLHHQGVIYRRDLLVEKPFDIGLRVYADYDFNLAMWLRGIKIFHTVQLVSVLGPGGVSDRPIWRNYREEMRVRSRYLHGSVLWLGHTFAVGRYFYKRLRQVI